MKKCIVISDSFKGTLSTFDIIDLFKKGVKEIFPNCNVLSFPIADGGEGTMETFSHALNGEIVTIDSLNSNMKKIKASYFISHNTAYMDVATCIFLENTIIKDPFITTSCGIGLMIKDAIKKGCRKIIIGLGGSSTNDAGCGIAYSLGAKFYDENNNEFLPTGGNLDKICSIDTKQMDLILNGIEIIGMCDVTNPLLYENGASRVYSMQKGVSLEKSIILDNIMEKFHKLMTTYYKDYSLVQGSGAAGGIGYGILTFLHGNLKRGIDVLLEAIDFEKYLDGVDIIFTGEGKIDNQTLNGKVVDGIRKIALKNNIPVVVIAGSATNDSESLIKNGIEAIVTTTRMTMDFSKIKPFSKDFYYISLLNTLRLIKLGMNLNK